MFLLSYKNHLNNKLEKMNEQYHAYYFARKGICNFRDMTLFSKIAEL